MPGTSVPGTQQPAGTPSELAQRICGEDVRDFVATALAMPMLPSVTATTSDDLFTCTYDLPDGSLVLLVRELSDVASAQAYFVDLQRLIGPSQALVGIASLGLPSYESASGSVIFLKDNKTLRVDSSALPDQIGPFLVSRGSFSYQIATNILAPHR